MCAWAVLTVARVQDLNCCCGRELHHPHHWLRQQNLEGLRLLVLPVSQYPNPPRGSGLPRVELDLPLGLALEILLHLGATILGANAWETQAVTDVKRKRKGEEAIWVKKKKRQTGGSGGKTKKATMKGWQAGGKKDEKQIRYSHPLMLFREWWEKERCVYFSSLITYRASGTCEMNLWLKLLNKHIPPYWDGLAAMIISQGFGMHVDVCVRVCVSLPFLFKCLLR